MKVTYEESSNSAFIYIYLRNLDRQEVTTIPNLKTDLLLDSDNNWLGITLSNTKRNGDIIDLPLLNEKYKNSKNEKIKANKEELTILFDSSLEANSIIEVTSNLDFNESGISGVELIIDNNFGNLGVVEPFLHRR